MYRKTVIGERSVVMREIELEAEGWGGSFKPGSGRLRLPVQAGLRYGWTEGTLTTETATERAPEEATEENEDEPRITLVLEIDTTELVVQKESVGILLLAGTGAVLVVLAPLSPVFLRLMPVGLMLSLAGWLFVVARLRNSGPEEFLAALTESGPDPRAALEE